MAAVRFLAEWECTECMYSVQKLMFIEYFLLLKTI